MNDNILEACATVRRRGFDGALILSLDEKAGGCDITALRAGVDEVLSGPVMADLLREKILLHAKKRALFLNKRDLLSIGRLRLCPELREVRFGDRPGTRITPIEMAILKILLLNAGRLVTRDSLFQLVWGCLACKESRSLDQHVMSLRRKLRFLCEGYATIQTVHRRGFVFFERHEEST
jgi:two-component system response regulator MprA